MLKRAYINAKYLVKEFFRDMTQKPEPAHIFDLP